ncbi:MAG: rRNA methyltransferase [Ilumatobacter coccineus]|uniref:rRNA methyltransferase n=1 Tax=Ilumatobacter coccineus TaxID=467094 RepID=A0A2G6K9G2_9ACTN|nr:MAG: rRNA methyltransferase [Ilumatobacter coccineus]
MTDFVFIERADDERIARFRLRERGLASRAERRDDAGAGLFLAEGDLVVERALTAGCVPVAALADAHHTPAIATQLANAGAEVYVGGDELRALVTGLGMPHPIIALFARPPRPSADDLTAHANRLVVIEAVDNPVNVGSIVRNAAALGWDGLLADHTSADPLSRRALRVAMGTAFSLPHARTTQLTEVIAHHREQDPAMTWYALTPSPDAVDITEITPTGRRALLIGSERSGLSDELLKITQPVRIPMAHGVDSLNAAAAAAVACYALR